MFALKLSYKNKLVEDSRKISNSSVLIKNDYTVQKSKYFENGNEPFTRVKYDL